MTNFGVNLVGVPETLRKIEALQRFTPIGMYHGAMDAADETVRLARALAPKLSGNLANSLQILESTMSGTFFRIVIGSSILGYPYWQEYGFEWHLRGKRGYVSGKYFLTTAVETIRPKVPQYIMARTKQVAGMI
jgi:hypothetical protein